MMKESIKTWVQQQVLTFFLDHWRALLVCVIIFLLSLPVGYFAPTEIKKAVLLPLLEKIDEIITPHDGLLFLRILWNNAGVGLLLMLLGFLIVPSLIILFSNGLIIGVVFSLQQKIGLLSNTTFLSFILGLLPHGIFEIPAIILSCTVGIAIGLRVILKKRYVPYRTKREVVRQCCTVFLVIILPLFIVAAVVETFVTPSIMNLFQEERTYPEMEQFLLLPEEITLSSLNVSISTSILQATDDTSFGNFFELFFNDTVFRYYLDREQSPHASTFWSDNDSYALITVRSINGSSPFAIDILSPCAMAQYLYRGKGNISSLQDSCSYIRNETTITFNLALPYAVEVTTKNIPMEEHKLLVAAQLNKLEDLEQY